MKIKNIELDDEEMPAKITVELTVKEAGLIYGLTGTIAPRVITELVGLEFGEALYEVADCLAGSFFNKFWENGAKSVIDLTTMRTVYAHNNRTED